MRTPTRRRVTQWANARNVLLGRQQRLRQEAVAGRIWTFDDLRIRAKDKRVLSFQPNFVQQGYLDIILPHWRDGDLNISGLGLQEIILKARQQGFSTLIAALFFLDTINHPNTGTVVISNDKPNTKKLFEMVDRMYRHLPRSQRPITQRANTDEIYWPALDCHYQVMTAGTKTSGRGWTVNNLHCSEVGFWDHPETLSGLLDAVPDNGNVFLESTANGEGSAVIQEDGELDYQGSPFHVYYEAGKKDPTRARERDLPASEEVTSQSVDDDEEGAEVPDDGTESPFTSRFFAWFQHPEYRKPAPAGFVRTTEADEDTFRGLRYGNEERLGELYGLDKDQLYWRRRMINKPGKGPAVFCQEYPANDVEAFRTSGKKFFAGLLDPEKHFRDVEIQPWWTPIGGFDHGYAVPYAGLVGWVFPLGETGHGVYVSDEAYGARVRNRAQAQALLDIMRVRAIEPTEITFYADPAMWAKKGRQQADNIGRADVEDYWDAGLSFVEANNNRAHGCTNMREYFGTPGALIISPACVNLCRTLPLVRHDPHDIECYEKSKVKGKENEQHAVDALRYLLNSRPLAPTAPQPATKMYYRGRLIRPVRELPPELRDETDENDGDTYEYTL